MDFTEEWKSLWPVSSVFSPPLLKNPKPDFDFGPLIFTPKQNDPTTTLLNSPTIAPRLPPRYCDLSVARFLERYNASSSITSLVEPGVSNHSSHFQSFNSLQLLRVPDKSLVIAFFPTGENGDQVGFSLLGVKSGSLGVCSPVGNSFQVVKEGCGGRGRIKRLLVNPFDDFFNEVGDGGSRNGVGVVVGFLLVCTEYSVYWYRVEVTTCCKENAYSVSLGYVGCADGRMLKGKSVVSACWSPHLREECLVLLEDSNVLLFDVNCSCERKGKLAYLVSGKNKVVGKRMHVSLNDEVGLVKEGDGGEGVWFHCEFSWHPRIFIAAHRDAVFLIDLRSTGECKNCCLLKIEMVSVVKNDAFLTLSMAGSDGFGFTLATRRSLVLCDVRKPLMPVLRWAHGLKNPCYMNVFRLSDLRANVEDSKYNWASESGYCILLGSFWDGEFNFFCYGPGDNQNESVSSAISKFCNSYYAWGLPSEISLSGYDCNCGSCLLRDEYSKASLPVWIDWRQKKHLVLGFDILDADISSQLSTPDKYGAFTLIRLMASGKLEAQQYVASWESKTISKVCHKRKNIYVEDSLLYCRDDAEHGRLAMFYHLALDYLNAYLKDDLAAYIVKRMEKRTESGEKAQKKIKVDSKFHEEICQKLKAFGLPRVSSSTAVSDVLKDICLPTSIHDVALRSLWAALPTNLLRLGFSTYSDFHEDLGDHNEPLEFLDIPEQLHVPPFSLRKPSHRSSRWSSKVPPYDTLVGPVLPIHFLTTLCNLSIEENKLERDPYRQEAKNLSVQSEFRVQCSKVMEVVDKHVWGSISETQDDDFISLGDDTNPASYGTQNIKLSYHKPLSFSETPLVAGVRNSGRENDIYSSHIFRRNFQELESDLSVEIVGQELFDVGCPIELKFDDRTIDFGPKELEAYRLLKKQELGFQKRFQPYQDYIRRGDETKEK